MKLHTISVMLAMFESHDFFFGCNGSDFEFGRNGVIDHKRVIAHRLKR